MKYDKEKIIEALQRLSIETKPNCEGLDCTKCDLVLMDEMGYPFCVFVIAEQLAGKLKEKDSNEKELKEN